MLAERQWRWNGIRQRNKHRAAIVDSPRCARKAKLQQVGSVFDLAGDSRCSLRKSTVAGPCLPLTGGCRSTPLSQDFFTAPRGASATQLHIPQTLSTLATACFLTHHRCEVH